jgi:hypothetical protein
MHRWNPFSPAKENGSLSELHLQFSTQTGITIILHFPIKSLAGVSAAKEAADNRAFDFIPVTGSVFHKAPPLEQFLVSLDSAPHEFDKNIHVMALNARIRTPILE